MGVSDVINYKETPDWEQEVLRLTNGLGVDQVIEVGGTGTLPKSLKSVRLWGVGDPDWAYYRITTLRSIPRRFSSRRFDFKDLGSGRFGLAEAMARTIAALKIKPVIAEVFGFEQARDALAKLQDPATFGKIVVRFE